jgi:hypothetical protein
MSYDKKLTTILMFCNKKLIIILMSYNKKLTTILMFCKSHDIYFN